MFVYDCPISTVETTKILKGLGCWEERMIREFHERDRTLKPIRLIIRTPSRSGSELMAR